jgi:hypothetical protein
MILNEPMLTIAYGIVVMSFCCAVMYGLGRVFMLMLG